MAENIKSICSRREFVDQKKKNCFPPTEPSDFFFSLSSSAEYDRAETVPRGQHRRRRRRRRRSKKKNTFSAAR